MFFFQPCLNTGTLFCHLRWFGGNCDFIIHNRGQSLTSYHGRFAFTRPSISSMIVNTIFTQVHPFWRIYSNTQEIHQIISDPAIMKSTEPLHTPSGWAPVFGKTKCCDRRVHLAQFLHLFWWPDSLTEIREGGPGLYQKLTSMITHRCQSHGLWWLCL